MIDLKELTAAVGALEEEKVFAMLGEFLKTNPSQEETQKVVAACQGGMAVIGDLFEQGEYYVGDLVFAGSLLTDIIEKLKPSLGSATGKEIASILLGTVEGDLHDIGKNIFRCMAEAAGFKVIDLGIDTPAEEFVAKVRENKPAIVGMSGVLTLALESMRTTVQALEAAGLRKDVKIIIGGNPVTQEACEKIAADAFTTNAAEGIKICQGWVS
ncbi:cobalamin B12-binding domain protein [Desulfitobacterium hafniense DCB-2]|uniref:Cobalamin B12-binding domain protein n=1 Tax=Desulfitobacterium hafniense (strain DSM 10664 / DCB-2) TaxID=272564 RepID=B8FQI7_DESHD|nr:cobalamin-dependent protein [Desulfitobacterium hafniense]ACL19877.1 cobalamin B12-binding domain protein [Desulfitobacterium hafniense DCB-2]